VLLLLLLLQAGESPLQLGPKSEESGKVNGNPLSFLLRLLLGTAAGFYYFLVSLGMHLTYAALLADV
jgi:MPBQ/MSBQ methyltransferase